MYQQQPYYQQQLLRQTPSTLKGRMVTSIDEARAAAIDFDGSVFYFPDLANRKIYTKQINMDGTSTLNMYELKEIPVNAANLENPAYITREEFEKVIAQLRTDLMPKPIPVEIEKKPSVDLNF